MGRTEGHARRDDRIRRAPGRHGLGPSRAGRPERRWCRRRPRGRRGAGQLPHHLADPARGRPAAASTWPACRWTTATRPPRWSTLCNDTPPSSCRRAWPRASGSPSPRPCGRPDRSSAAQSAGSSTRSSPARPAISSPIPHDLTTFADAARRSSWSIPPRPTGWDATASITPASSSSATATCSSGPRAHPAPMTRRVPRGQRGVTGGNVNRCRWRARISSSASSGGSSPSPHMSSR